MWHTALRYVLVSITTVCLGLVVIGVAFGLLHWSARSSNYVAFVVTGVPSYYLNRAWAWKKTGRSHLLKEVIPFWTVAFAGLATSTWSVDFVDSHAAAMTSSRVLRTGLVMFATMAAFGVIWILKFLVLNRYLFAPVVAEPTDARD